MGKQSSRIDKVLRQVIVCLFLVVGIVGIIYSYKCIKAQASYTIAKHGISFPFQKSKPASAGQELFEEHDLANSNYPHNYYYHSFVAHEVIKQVYLVADAIYGNQDSLKAISQIHDNYKRSENNPDLSLGELYEILAKKALYFAELAIGTNPYDEGSRLMYKEALVLCGKTDEAIEYWKGVVDLEYWNRSHHDVMAELYLYADDIPMAIKERKHVLNPELKKMLQRKFEEYKKEARLALGNAKKISQGLNLDLEVYNNALSSTKCLIEIDPYDKESQRLYLEALVVCGQTDEAIAYWEGVVDLDNSNTTNHEILADLYLNSGNISMAVKELPYISNPKLQQKLQKYKDMLEKREVE